MAVKSKTFTNLTDMPTGQGIGRVLIGKCSFVLPNHMQCWRSGDFMITTVEDNEDKEVVTHYQMCRRHAQAEKNAYDDSALQAQAAANNAAQATPALPAKPVVKPLT